MIIDTCRGITSVNSSFYSALYMECYDGLHVINFDQVAVLEFCKIMSYHIFHSFAEQVPSAFLLKCHTQEEDVGVLAPSGRCAVLV
ncbi:unnamed protein product [Urochloa humidicola]